MEFTSAFYAFVATFLLFSYYVLSLTSSKPRAPPKAGGARPFTGHLHLISGCGSSAQLPHFNLATLADKHGPIFTIRLGMRRALVVSSWELVKEVFTTLDAVVSYRPKLRASRHLSYDFAMFGFSPYGPYWQKLRKLVNVELLSPSKIEMQSNVRVLEIEQSINELYRLWEKKRDGSGRVLVDMKQWFGDLNLNVVLRAVVGKRFKGGDDVEETRRCREVLRDFFHLAGLFVPADAFPCLGWLDLGGHEKRMKETAKKLDNIVGEWLAEHRESKEYFGEDKLQDFMDVMMSVVPGANLHGRYDVDTIIKATCEVLIAGGTDTITVMLVWTLSLLLNNSHVLRRAQEELDEHVGRERRINDSDIDNLVYLQAIVKETLRLYPAGPISLVREFSKDCHVGGYYVPKGTWLIVNMWKLHRDPQVWSEDCLEFKPERFLDKNIDVKGVDFELIPFGAGRRICPGLNFGMHTIHFVLANFLQVFEFSLESNKEVDMTASDGLTNMKATPLNVLIAPRLSPSLY